MFSFFQIEKTFGKASARIYSDVKRGEAHLTVVYDRRIVAIGDIVNPTCQRVERFGRVEYVNLLTPEGAEAFLSRDMGERGSFIEEIEWRGSRGLIAA